jgi:hypothetical protein
MRVTDTAVFERVKAAVAKANAEEEALMKRAMEGLDAAAANLPKPTLLGVMSTVIGNPEPNFGCYWKGTKFAARPRAASPATKAAALIPPRVPT